jgi:hypothetical protein
MTYARRGMVGAEATPAEYIAEQERLLISYNFDEAHSSEITHWAAWAKNNDDSTDPILSRQGGSSETAKN